MSAPLDSASRLASAGLRVFPAKVTAASDPSKFEKRPLVHWRMESTSDEMQLERWWQDEPTAAIGIDLAPADLVVIDLDRHGGPDGVAAFNELCTGRELPPGPITDTPTGGRHLYFRQPKSGPLGNARGRLPAGIDVRGVGGFVVGPGSCRPDGKAWRTASGCPDLADAFQSGDIPELPEWLASIIRTDKALHKGETELDSTSERERHYAAVALEHVSREVSASHEGSRNNTLNAAAYRMGRFVGSGWIEEGRVREELIRACQKNGLANDDERAALKTILSGLSSGRTKPLPSLPLRFKPNMQEPTDHEHVTSRFPLWWHGEPTPHNERRWLVQGILPEGAVGLLSGQSSVGKSFVALDLAASIMTGEPFAGRNVGGRGGILFVAAEGAFEIPSRLKAIVEERIRPAGLPDLNPDELPFAMADGCPPLLHDGKANGPIIGELINAARSARARLVAEHQVELACIVIDTVAAAAGFTDENDAAQAQALFRALNFIGEATGAAILGVDHFGKSTETGTRGSSAKEAAADVVLAVIADKDLSGKVTNRRLAVRKLRAGEQGIEIPFDLRPVQLGVDADGHPVGQLVVEWLPTDGKRGSARPKRLTPAVTILLDSIGTAGCEDGAARDMRVSGDGPLVRAVDREAVRKVFNDRYPADGETEEQRRSARRQAFKRATELAQAKYLIGVENDDLGRTWVWPIIGS